MTQIFDWGRTWGAPTVGVVFAALWYLAEYTRIPSNLFAWEGFWPLSILSVAISIAAVLPRASLVLVGLLLVGQLTRVVDSVGPTTWPIYVATFVALAFILWTGSPRLRRFAAGINLVFAGVISFLMVSRQYGSGVGWFRVAGAGPWEMVLTGLHCFALLLAMAGGLAAIGFFFLAHGERTRLQREAEQARELLHQTEMALVLQQEHSRISRELHEALANSLAVITAQADGARYQNPHLPETTTQALMIISHSSRTAMVDAQNAIRTPVTDSHSAGAIRLRGTQELAQCLGLTFTEHVLGEPWELNHLQQLTVSRIVEESLTNASKYAKSDSIEIVYDWAEAQLRLTITSTTTDIQGPTRHSSTGKGIEGMKARAELAGGRVTTAVDGNRFLVILRLPLSKALEVDQVLDSAQDEAVA